MVPGLCLEVGRFTYNILEPDLVKPVESETLHIGGGRFGQSSGSSSFDLRQRRQGSSSDLSASRDGSAKNGHESSLHDVVDQFP